MSVPYISKIKSRKLHLKGQGHLQLQRATNPYIPTKNIYKIHSNLFFLIFIAAYATKSTRAIDWSWKSYWQMWGVTGVPGTANSPCRPWSCCVLHHGDTQEDKLDQIWQACIYFSSNQEQNCWGGRCHQDITAAAQRIIFGILTYYILLIHIWYYSNTKLLA